MGIRIEPDWNVNFRNVRRGFWGKTIRIEPDWNVNDVYIMQRGGWSSLE